MYLENLHIKNFRCINDLVLDFHKGINILIGENDTGKTAVLDALRVCLGLGAERREIYLTPDDFHIYESGEIADTIEFHLTFGDISTKEQGVFIELLAIPEGQLPKLQLHIRFTYDPLKDRIRREYWGGEKEGQNVPSQVLELIYFIHLGALRDASRDLTPGRGNRLSKLFLKLVPERDEQEEYEKEINDQIRSVPRLISLLKNGKTKINKHLNRVSLRNAPQRIDIDFVDKTFRGIMEGLKLRIPFDTLKESHEEDQPVSDRLAGSFKIWQNGLGSNNLIYIATVLGDLFEKKKREPDSFISLLIEEPEAHLHPQLQNVLFPYLKEIETHNVQLFVTSHSPTITAKTHIDSLIVLTDNARNISSTPLKNVALEERHKKYLQRFLDVTKSQLFFAKGVILVEGISEALLLPCFAKLTGQKYDLARNAVEIVNIGGVSFEPFAKIFNSDNKRERLNIRCAILTDDDREMITATDEVEISSRAASALELAGGMVAKPFLAKYTFEYELYYKNEILVAKVYRELHPRTGLEFNGTIEQRALQFVDKIKTNRDKAVFAQLLAQEIEENVSFQEFVVPNYIQHAIKWVVDGNDERTN